MYKSVALTIIGILIFTFLVSSHASTQEIRITEIKGVITDESKGIPVENAIIEAVEGGVSRMLSDARGQYRFFLINAPTITLEISKEGYKPYSRTLEPRRFLEVDVRLEPVKEAEVSILMTKFRSGSYIKGKVSGLKEGEHGRYKLLVYVLTNKWYIHPYAENREGKGYASIKSDGSWTIQTVWRGYQAFKVAFLIVDKDYYPPSVVEISEGEADQSLLEKVHPHCYNIQKAPEGI